MQDAAGENLGNLTQRSDYIVEIDTVRAVAVIAVLLFHAYPAWFPGGFIGVDIFFVVSGFVIARSYLPKIMTGQASISDFIHARFRRLLPAFIFVLTSVTVVAFLTLYPDDLLRYAYALTAQAFYVQNFVFWAEGDYFEKAIQKPLLHTWSLAVEEQFYIVFAASLYLLGRHPKLLLTLLLVAIAVSISFGILTEPISPKTTFFLLPGRLWQLGLGILAWLILYRIGERRFSVSTALPVACFSAMIASALFFDEHARFPGIQSYLACGATAIALIVFGVNKQDFKKILALPKVTYVGQISYPLYLWHWPVLSLLALNLQRDVSEFEATAAIIVAFLLSVITKSYIERPFRDHLFLPLKRKMLVAAGASLGVTFAAGFILLETQGALFRYPAALASYFAAAQERTPSYRCGKIFRIQNPTKSICPINDLADQNRLGSILIIGDSHADMLDEMIAKVGTLHELGVFMSVRNCDLGSFGDYPYCDNREFEKIITESRSSGVRHVLAISRLDGRTLSLEAIRSEVEKLGNAGLATTIMLQVPFDETYNPSSRARMAARGNPLRTYGTTRSDFEQFTRQQRQIFARLAASLPRVRVIDPMDWLCKAEACVYEVKGYPIYHDADHLNSKGAALLKPMFIDLFVRHFTPQLGNGAS